MAKDWIRGAIKRPGAFKAKAERAHMSTEAFARKHEHDKDKLGKEARLALTLRNIHHHTTNR